MANYIKNEVLSESYSHLNIDLGDDPVALDKLKLELVSFFTERAQFFFGEAVAVEVEFDTGSLITRIKVVGKAAIIIGIAINTYGNFRQSIDYLVKDSTLLAQSANLEIVFRTKTEYCDRMRIEKRKGVFGRIDELLGELDSIKASIKQTKMPRSKKAADSYSKHQLDRLISWEERLNKLMAKLDHNDTKACVSSGFLEELETLPESLPWENDTESKNISSVLVKSDPELYAEVKGLTIRYKRTIQQIKKALENQVKEFAPQST